MSMQKVIKVLAHNSIYNAKTNEQHYGRTIDCTYTLPDTGCNAETGFLVLLPNFGQTASEEMRLRDCLADDYNLIVVQCDYFGKKFMEPKDCCSKAENWAALKEIFSEAELALFSEGEYLNIAEIVELGKHKSDKTTLYLQEDLSEESVDECNDQSIMQALDYISSLVTVREALEQEGVLFDRSRTIFCGSGLGGYLAHLANALAPHLVSCIIDVGGWLKPVYLADKRCLIENYNNFTCYRQYSYLAEKLYDKELTALPYLYKHFSSRANIFSCYPKQGNFAERHKKELFCQMIKAEFSLFENDDVLDLYKSILAAKKSALSVAQTEPEELLYQTAQGVYRIKYSAGRPYVDVLKNEFYLAVMQLRRLLFRGKLTECREKIFAFLKENEELFSSLDPKSRTLLNEILPNLFFALQDQDYLLAADLLKFDILPLLG